MKVMFVIPYAPTRVRVRSLNLILGMSRLGHEVTVASPWTGDDELKALEALRSKDIEVIAFRLPAWKSALNCMLALPTATPLQAAYSWHSDLARRISAELEDPAQSSYDVIHFEHIRGARYGLYLEQKLRQTGGAVPIVWDSVDCISDLFRQTWQKGGTLTSRWAARFEMKRTRRLEQQLGGLFSQTLVTSSDDRTALLEALNGSRAAQKARITVLPNGVDLEYFVPDKGQTRETATVVLSGKMSYHANVAMVEYFMREIFPALTNRLPHLNLWIVGKSPPASIVALGKDPRVTVTGTVPDIRPYLQRATIAAAPITYGAGIQNKVLEAMACGTPVVASRKASLSLQAKAGREILVAETPHDFVTMISDLVHDSERRRKVGLAGRAYVERHHRWSAVSTQLEGIYRGLNRH